MANFYAQYPAAVGSASNPSVGPGGQPAPSQATEVGGVGPDGNLYPLSTDNSGVLNVNLASSLVPTSYDEIDLTYVASGNGVGQIETATYKQAGVAVRTLTLSYDGSNRLTTVVAS